MIRVSKGMGLYDDAQELDKEGRDFYDKGDFLESAQRFKEAGQAYQKVLENSRGNDVKLRLARDSIKSYGKSKEAFQEYQSLARSPKSDISPWEVRRAVKEISWLGNRIGSMEHVKNELSSREKIASKKFRGSSHLEGRVHSVVAVFSILSFLAALFFLSLNFTGAVIGNVSSSGSQGIGLGLIILGLVLAFTYFKNHEEPSRSKKKR